MVNLFASRRIEYSLCDYWHRDKSVRDLTELAHNIKPAGSFYAKEVSAKSNDRNKLNDAFMFDESVVTIQTSDIQDVKANDLIRYNDLLWLVLNVQQRKVVKNRMYMKNPTVITYIQVKRQ